MTRQGGRFDDEDPVLTRREGGRRAADGHPTTHVPIGERREGVIARLVHEKGFGFIRVQGEGDYFFHYTALINGAQMDDLVPDETHVTFVIADRGKGPRAEQIDVV